MLKLPCLFLSLCYFVVGSYDSNNLVPFIDKCEASDKVCLVASARKAVPHFAGGIALLGIKPMDPLYISKVTFKEAGLRVELTNMTLTGLSKCDVLNVERDVQKNLLRLEFEYPIDIVGDYDAAGDLFLTKVEGNGPFHVNCNIRVETATLREAMVERVNLTLNLVSQWGDDNLVKFNALKTQACLFTAKKKSTGSMKYCGHVWDGSAYQIAGFDTVEHRAKRLIESIHLKFEIGQTTEVGKDGVKYWKIGKATYTYEAKKQATFHFENMFNGDQEKEKAVTTLMNDNWPQMMQIFGKPLMNEAMVQTVNAFQSFCKQVPANQLEK